MGRKRSVIPQAREVTLPGGSREAQQCKRKNRTTGKWTIGELARKDVLTNLALQLRRTPAAKFTFVSADPAPELRELTDTARMAGGDADGYFGATLAVSAHARGLRQFCAHVGADERSAEGRRFAFDLLCRTYTHLFDDSPEGRNSVTVMARCLVSGDAETVVEVLADFVQDRLGTVVTVDAIRRHLRDRGMPASHLTEAPQAGEQLERLNTEFRESLRPTLIQSKLVSRPEAETVFKLLTSGVDQRLVVIHGRSGTGKSCVLYQLGEMLTRSGVPFLPLRLDRRPPQTSARKYGVDVCGLPESPAVVLGRLYPNARPVLILDQLDAVRWTSSHASATWEVCREIIDEALGLPNVVVVAACRTFDLRDDQQIQTWHAARRGREVEIGLLPDVTVAAIATSAGGNPNALTTRQRMLLRSPLHLALWVQVQPLDGWNSHSDLLRDYWRSRFAAAERMGVPGTEVRSAVAAVVDEMDRRGDRRRPHDGAVL